MIVADTSGLVALFDEREPRHVAVQAVVEAEPEPLIVSPYVVAEVDDLLATRLGAEAELAVLDELAGGAYHLACLGADDLRGATNVIERYEDQDLGIADAALVVLAAKHQTRSILTLDHRHFGVVRPLRGGRFTLLP